MFFVVSVLCCVSLCGRVWKSTTTKTRTKKNSYAGEDVDALGQIKHAALGDGVDRELERRRVVAHAVAARAKGVLHVAERFHIRDVVVAEPVAGERPVGEARARRLPQLAAAAPHLGRRCFFVICLLRERAACLCTICAKK